MQQTLILLKPDCVHRRLVGTIIQRFEQKGLRLAGMKLVQANRDLAERHYAVHKGKPFYEPLLQFLVSGPTVAMVWEGREAVQVARTLMGPTDGTKAPPYALVPSLEEKAIEAGQAPPQSAFRDALRTDGWQWLLYELSAMILFAALSMGLDRLRSLKDKKQKIEDRK